MTRRLFKVQVNLDDMGADLIRWRTDTERADWLTGFMVGCHGHNAPGSDNPALQAGTAFGLRCHAGAVAFSATQASRGRASVKAREAKYGSATPGAECEPNVNHGSATVQPRFEPDTNLSSIQYPIASSHHRETNGSQKKTPENDLFGTNNIDIPVATTPKEDWFAWRKSHSRLFIGRSDEDGSVAQWRDLLRDYGTECMDAMYEHLTRTIPAEKSIGYNQALRWLKANTED